MQAPNTADELHPHVLYHTDGAQARCATWRLEQGHEALALFTSADFAEAYRATADLDDTWQAFRPDQPALIAIFRNCQAGGILYAVLDPDGTQAKRIFDIPQILSGAEET